MSEELKNKIRIERMISIMSHRYNIKGFAYFKDNSFNSLKDITEEDVKKCRIKHLKLNCLKLIGKYEFKDTIKNSISDYTKELDKEMTEDEIILYIYRIYLLITVGAELDKELLDKSLDELEEIIDYNKQQEKSSNKRWWNIFF